MGALVYVILAAAAVFVSFKANIIVGIAVTAALTAYVIYSKYPDIWAIKARSSFAEGKFAEAKRRYKKAVDTGRAKPSTRIEYADALMRTGNFEDAEQALNNLLRYKLKPEIANTAKMRRCMAYFKQNNLEEAYNDAMEIYESGYKNTYLYSLLGYFKICKNSKAQETLDFCKEAYDYNGDERDIADNLALCYYYRGEYDKAKELSDKIMEGNPKFVEAYYHGAMIEKALGNYEKALEYLEKTPSCRWSAMTTVTKPEVEKLKEEVSRAAR